MKSRILILQEGLFLNPDANAKLVYRICSQLRDRGYDVTMLGVASYEGEHVEEHEGIHLIHKPVDSAKSAQALSKRFGRCSWLRYIICPRMIWYRLNNKKYDPIYLEIRRWLSKHVNEYDAVIACCTPYYELQLAAEVADRIPVIYYKIDPVASWFDKSNKDAALATEENEIEWDNVAQRIIMPDVVYRSFMRMRTSVNAHKAVVAQFPNVRRIFESQKSKVESHLKNKNQINLLFVGRFYADIRNPQYLFDLMEKIEGTNIVLHIVGPLTHMGFDKEYIDKYFTNKIPNIRFHGAVPPAEADALLLKADVLVHVGNSVDTAMPSKILDYISSGKPIINLCKVRTCPTIPLMERYPMGMTIFEDEGISELISERVWDFCIVNKGKQIPYEEIEKIYPECTIEYVGKQFDDTIQEAIKEFKQK